MCTVLIHTCLSHRGSFSLFVVQGVSTENGQNYRTRGSFYPRDLNVGQEPFGVAVEELADQSVGACS